MTTQQNLGACNSLEAGADLSSAQYTFVTYNASGQVVQQSVAGASCIGVLRTVADAAGKAICVDSKAGAIVKVVAGAAQAINIKVQSDGSGRAILAAAADHVQGLALDAAGAAGELIRVQLLSEHIL